MDKYFNDTSIVFGLVGGFVCNLILKGGEKNE